MKQNLRIQTNVSTDLIQPTDPQPATHALTFNFATDPQNRRDSGCKFSVTSEVVTQGQTRAESHLYHFLAL